MNELPRFPMSRWLRAVPRGGLMALAVLLLVLVQTLGLVHGVRHAGAASQSPAAAYKDFAFGHDAGSADCRLLDQLAHADVAPLPVMGEPPLPARATCAVRSRALPSGAPQWHPQARGPPVRA